jgi:uncharacterized membrane protein
VVCRLDRGAIFGAIFGAVFGAIFGAVFGAIFGAIFGAYPSASPRARLATGMRMHLCYSARKEIANPFDRPAPGAATDEETT